MKLPMQLIYLKIRQRCEISEPEVYLRVWGEGYVNNKTLKQKLSFLNDPHF